MKGEKNTMPTMMGMTHVTTKPIPPLCMRPCNRGNRHYKEAGPSIQEHIKNFVETDYLEDAGIWKPTATYPEDTVKVRELDFTQSPNSNQADGLLFDPTGMSPLDFFHKMWPCELFDHMAAETNQHYDHHMMEGTNSQFSDYDHFIDILHQTGTHLHVIASSALW